MENIDFSLANPKHIELVKKADQKMYEAKITGKDKIVT
jgi:PleD family two-component response regulator